MPADHAPLRLRCAGLVATALLAGAAFAAGALPGTDPAMEVRETGLLAAQPRYLVGTAAWLLGTGLLVATWWRLRGTAPSVGWLLVTGVLWALPLLVAPPLASRDGYAYACQGAGYLDGHDPYALGAAAGCPWVDAVPEVWRDSPAPYGPLAIVVSAAAVALVRALPLSADAELPAVVVVLRLAAVAGVALLAGYGIRVARAVGVPPASAVWLGVVTPLVAVHAVSGVHNDALLAGLVVAGLAIAAAPVIHQRDVNAALAGVALGLAVAVKVTALVAIPFAVLLVSPASAGPPARVSPASAGPLAHGTVTAAAGLRRGLARAAVTVVGAAVTAFALLSTVTGLGLGWLAALSDSGSLVQWTSPPTGVGMTVGYLLRALGWPQAYEEAVAVARLLGLAVLGTVLIGLWRRGLHATQQRTVVARAGAALAATALLAPVFYPWYAITALAVLATSTVDTTTVDTNTVDTTTTVDTTGDTRNTRNTRNTRALAIATAVLAFLVLPYGLGVAVLTKLPGALLDVAALVALGGWWLVTRRRRTGPTTPTATT